MRTRARRALVAAIGIWVSAAGPAAAGWILERTTHTEGAPGPSSRVTLFVSNGRVKELHDDGTYFLWDVPRGTLFQVDPRSKIYSGGPVNEMIGQVRKYLDDMRERIARMTDEQREELARRAEGLPMPVPPPATAPRWSVKATPRTATIAGRTARLYEISRDGSLFEERWLASSTDFAKEIDYPRYARWSRELESAFATGMGSAVPSGASVDALVQQGIEMKNVIVGSGVRVVSEVTRLDKAEIPDSTFTLPTDYRDRSVRTREEIPGPS